MMPRQDREARKAYEKEYFSRPEVKERQRVQAKIRYDNGGSEKKKLYDAERRKIPEVKEKRSKYMKARSITDWAGMKIAQIKCKCKRTGLTFNITKEDIVLPEFCPILGVKLKINDRVLGNDSPSVDRVIPELGYVKGNVVVISTRANSLKKSATLSELIALVQFYLALSNEPKG